MTSRQRMLAALQRQKPDRLPVTTHHMMPYFLKHRMGGCNNQEFFDSFGLDAITWVLPYKPDTSQGCYFSLEDSSRGNSEGQWVVNDSWQIRSETLPHPEYETTRYSIRTPARTLTMVMQRNEYTGWLTERPVKEKRDIDLIAEFAPSPLCDGPAVNRAADAFGERGLVRGNIPCFEIFGQPGCWQDAACLYGVEELILATYDDPEWVHQFLRILCERKKPFLRSLAGVRYDLLELGGGDASSTVISPRLLDEFVAPYDKELIGLAHQAGQRIVYHTCGGMMPILENLAALGPDALETFTPLAMGGDARLAEAKARIGDRVCMIGGFDQFHFFTGCTPVETAAEVRRCFREAGESGGYILSPSDHFFDAEPELLRAFAETARECGY